jgi:hypothetical protein
VDPSFVLHECVEQLPWSRVLARNAMGLF